MKQARRKELKTNELSIYLQQIQEAVTRNANYIIGGIVVVVLILMIGLYVQSSRHQAEAARWNELEELQKPATEVKPETVDRAAALADETAGDSTIGPKARELHADLLYRRALAVSPVSNPGDYVKLLKEAQASYQTLIDGYAKLPAVVARARLNMGSVVESLAVANAANLDEARSLYNQVIDSGKSDAALKLYAEQAAERLETLADRTRPLEIVATMPAEPVATAPAATTPAAPAQPAPAEAAPATAPSPQ